MEIVLPGLTTIWCVAPQLSGGGQRRTVDCGGGQPVWANDVIVIYCAGLGGVDQSVVSSGMARPAMVACVAPSVLGCGRTRQRQDARVGLLLRRILAEDGHQAFRRHRPGPGCSSPRPTLLGSTVTSDGNAICALAAGLPSPVNRPPPPA